MNGIVYVTEILRRNFEALGHEVYVFAPAPSLNYKSDDPHIIRFPAVRGVVFEDFNNSLFFPPTVVKRIKELDLDVIHFLTPGQVGLMGVYAAHQLNVPLVAEYCTDLFEYVEHYPMSVVGIVALGSLLPFTFKASREEIVDMIRTARPRMGVANWNRGMIKHLITVLHAHCRAVIVHSRKSQHQLTSWQDDDEHYPLQLIPTGVDALPAPRAKDIAAFKKQHDIRPEDEVITFAGRLSAEKNLDMLIEMINDLIKWRPNVKLMYVGDFPDYRPVLEEKAAQSPAARHIIFAGKLPREELGVPFAVTKVFAFPSQTDTQGLVLHEAAHAGLPIVMVDREVSEVMHDGENGFYSENDPFKMAGKICQILEDPVLAQKMRAASRRIAVKYSEHTQAQRIIKVYEAILAAHPSSSQSTDHGS